MAFTGCALYSVHICILYSTFKSSLLKFQAKIWTQEQSLIRQIPRNSETRQQMNCFITTIVPIIVALSSRIVPRVGRLGS